MVAQSAARRVLVVDDEPSIVDAVATALRYEGFDVLEAGENYNNPDNGNDTLIGNGGSDVLYADPGADQLSGGPGDDLLVSSVAVCQGHTYDGRPGDDTVSYGRSDAALTVELGGTGGPSGCGSPDQVGASNESLEGSDGPDVLIGDPPLFPRQEEVELSWQILDPVEEFWASHDKPEQYPAGSQGPPSADALLARDGRSWRRL